MSKRFSSIILTIVLTALVSIFLPISASLQTKNAVGENSQLKITANRNLNSSPANSKNNSTASAPLFCTPPAANLVGWWNGQETSADASGLGNHGTFVGSQTYADGIVARAFGFNGTSNYVAVDRNFVPAITNTFTFSAWINASQVNGDRPIISKQNTQNYQSSWNWGIENGKLRLTLYQDPRFSFSRTVRTVNSIPTGSFVHVAATFTPGTDIRLFVNGVQAATTVDANSSQINSITSSTAPVRIGAVSGTSANDNPSAFFAGIVDEAQIYNRALSATEINAIFNANAAGVCSGATFTPSVSNGKIAFNASGASSSDVFTVNNDGTNSSNVLNNVFDEVSNEWSPDGNRLLYASSDVDGNIDIYAMNANGTNQIRLTNDPASDDTPAWSPDGSKIAFASTRETGNYQIFLMNSDGSNQVRLTTSDGIDYFPRFSPDGSRIAFVSNRGGNDDIWIMNADGSGAFNLTNNAADDFEPTWSPDNLKIAFTSNRSGNEEIWVVNADGGNLIDLTNNAAQDYQPAWSPDASKIAFTSDRGAGQAAIFTMNADGSNQTRLTPSNLDASFASWQAAHLPISITSAGQTFAVKFASVQQSGYTIATPLTQNQLPNAALPDGYSLFLNSPMYDVRTSAIYTGSIDVTFYVPNIASAAACSHLRSLHYENNVWTSDTNSAPVYNAGARVCAVTQTVSSLSPFVIAQIGSSISGQITLNGNPLANVTVNLTGAITDSTRTDNAGNYAFVGLDPGDYVVAPSATNYSFAPTSTPFYNLTANQTANFAATQCSYQISPNGANAPAAASNNSFSIATSAGCGWTAVANDNWLGIVGSASGVGNGTIQYSVAANNGAQRTGSISIGNQTFLVTQQETNYSIGGTITYANTPANEAAKLVANVSLTVANDPTVMGSTNSSGVYQLSNLAAGGNYTVTPAKTGNINGITSFDATLVLRCVAAGSNCALTQNQKIAADADGNNQLSAFDATLILRFAAASTQTSNTGQVGNWRFNPAQQNYPSLANSLANENYQAILVGEINGNWTPTGNLPAEIGPETGVQTIQDVFVKFGKTQTER